MFDNNFVKKNKLSSIFPLVSPSPNFKGLVGTLKGEKITQRIHWLETEVSDKVVKFLLAELMDTSFPNEEKWAIFEKKHQDFFDYGKPLEMLSEKSEETYYENLIKFYYYMGYDCLPDITLLHGLIGLLKPKFRELENKNSQQWLEEDQGRITSWEDFNAIPWDKMEVRMDSWLKFMNNKIPPNFKVVPFFGTIFFPLIFLLGLKSTFYLVYDDRQLVEAIINKIGTIQYSMMEEFLKWDCIGGLWCEDDLGFKTGTFLNPQMLRELIFPWYEKFIKLANLHGKPCFFHCCGNKTGIMEDLIGMGFDAVHSFEDSIIPVKDFYRKYGKQIGIIGGVDMDKLIRLEKEELKVYIQDILDNCFPEGRYVFGSGNSISDFVNPERYLLMLETAYRWKA